jgi:hypothetical protein
MKARLCKTVVLTAFLTAVFAISCSLETSSIGHLSVTVPYAVVENDNASRAIVFNPSDIPYVRLYIMHNGSFVDLGTDTDYVEKRLAPGSTYSIDLEASSGYSVYAAIGKKVNGYWIPRYYGATGAFAVSAGVYSEQTIKVIEQTGEYIASSSSTGSVSIDGTVWRAYSSVVTNGSVNVDISSTGTFYSLSSGQWFSGNGGYAKEVWINTNSGIYTVSGTALVRRASFNAVNSGSIIYNDKLVVLYYGSDVGYASSADRGKASVDKDWDSNGLTEFLASEDGESFRNLIPDPGKLVVDATFIGNGSESYGFVATTLGTYLYNEKMKEAMGTDKKGIILWVKGQLTSSTYAISLYNSAKKTIPIISVAFDSDASPSYVYAGTDTGLYYASALGVSSSTNAPLLSKVSGPTGRIVHVAATALNGVSYVAVGMNDGTVSLWSNRSGTFTAIASYPFYSYTSTSSGLRDIGLYTAGTSIRLALSCNDGIMMLTF